MRGCWWFITGDVLDTNVLSSWSNMTAGSPEGTSICHGDHVRARGLRVTLDDTRFPLVVMQVKYTPWVTRLYGRKGLGRPVVLRLLLILCGAWCLPLHLQIMTDQVWVWKGGLLGILWSSGALLVMQCCGQVGFCVDITWRDEGLHQIPCISGGGSSLSEQFSR